MLQLFCTFPKFCSCFIIGDHFYIHGLTVLSIGAPFSSESSGITRMPKEDMESLIYTLEVMAPEDEALACNEDVVTTVEAEVSVLEESLALETEGPFLRRAWLQVIMEAHLPVLRYLPVLLLWLSRRM